MAVTLEDQRLYAAHDWAAASHGKTPMWGRSYVMDRKAGEAARGYIQRKAHAIDPRDHLPFIIRSKKAA